MIPLQPGLPAMQGMPMLGASQPGMLGTAAGMLQQPGMMGQPTMASHNPVLRSLTLNKTMAQTEAESDGSEELAQIDPSYENALF